MEQEKLNEIHAMLVQRKLELQTVTIHTEQALREHLAPDQDEETQVDYNHPADGVVGDSDYEKEISLIRRERAELALVSSALARIEQGTYGHCAECGNEIPLARLKAIPYTKYCITCREDKDAAAQIGGNAAAQGANPHDVENLGV